MSSELGSLRDPSELADEATTPSVPMEAASLRRTSSLRLSLHEMPTDIVTKTMEPFGREVVPAFRR